MSRHSGFLHASNHDSRAINARYAVTYPTHVKPHRSASQADHSIIRIFERSVKRGSGIKTFATASGSTMTHAESLDEIAEVGTNNHYTSNGVWLVHPTDAATLGAQTKDSGSGQFVY